MKLLHSLKNRQVIGGILEGIKNIGSNYLTKAIVTVDNRRNFLLFSIQDVNLDGEKVATSIGVAKNTFIVQLN